MHWSVEISTLGKSAAAPERLEVEATQWQNALKSARNRTGLDESLRNFSIEVLEDGVRAVDPANRLRYVVRKIMLEPAAQQPPAEEPIPSTQRLGSVPPPTSESWTSFTAPKQESFKPKAVAVPAIPMDTPPPPPARPMMAPPPAPEERPKPASIPPAAPVAAAPAPARQLVPHKQVLSRASEPTPGSPLTYRELGFAVLPFTTEAEAEELILAKFDEIKQSLAHVARGKLVNIAIFDHEFDNRPLRPPLVALIWKDWRQRDPEIHYPSRPGGTSPSLTPSIPPAAPVAAPPEPPTPEPTPQPAPIQEPAGQALYQEPVRVPPRTAAEPAPAQSVIISPAVRAAAEPSPAPQPAAPQPVAPPVVAPAAVTAPQSPVAAAPVEPRTQAVEAAAPVSAAPATAVSASAEEKVDTQPEIPAARRESRPAGATMPSADLDAALKQGPAPVVAGQPASKPQPAAAPQEPVDQQKAREPKAEEKKPAEPAKKVEDKKPVVVATVEPAKAKPATKPTPIPKTGARLSDDELITDLFEAAADLAFLRDAEEGADFVLNLVLEKFRSQAGMVQLYDINKREFVIMRAAGPHANLVLGGRTAERDPLVHEIMKRRRPHVLDVAKDGRVRAGRWAALGANPKMILAAAVELHGQFLGIIEIANPVEGSFSNAEVNGMAYLAERFAEFLAGRGIVFESDTSLQTGK